MNIDHIEIWTKQLEKLKVFYVNNFSASIQQRVFNPKTQFDSYLLSFANGPLIEIMQAPEVKKGSHSLTTYASGLAHLAFSVGSKTEIHRLTDHLRKNGCLVIDLPRVSGDGFFESIVLDPDGNRIEIKE